MQLFPTQQQNWEGTRELLMLHEMNPQAAVTVEYFFPLPRQINRAGAQMNIPVHIALHISKYAKQNPAQF